MSATIFGQKAAFLSSALAPAEMGVPNHDTIRFEETKRGIIGQWSEWKSAIIP